MTLFGMLSLSLSLLSPAHAQGFESPAPSPHAAVTQQVGLVEITVDYSSPGKKDREIWGALVPYGELWRTGANGATTLETTGEVTIGGTVVPAGKYAVFTIPGDKEWTFILNKNPDQGGTGDYDQALDLLRTKVAPEQGQERERLTFVFSDTTDDATRLDLVWAGLRVSVPIQVDTAKMMKDQLGTFTSEAAGQLAQAGRYQVEHGDVDAGLKLLDASIAVERDWFNVWLRADALHRKEDHKAAYKAALEANELGKAAGDGFFWKERVEKALAEWKKK